jgi:RNA polymerase sigma-B factor
VTDARVPEEAMSDAELFADRDNPDHQRQLVDRYGPLADRLAWRFRGRGESIDDLKQVAALGLVHAMHRFDIQRNVRFATYATVTILGELRRHLRDKAWSVRVPRSLQERWLEASRAAADLSQELGASPTVDQIATRIGASVEEVLEAMDAGSSYTAGSLDAPAGSEPGSATIGDLVADVDLHLDNADNRIAVSDHLRRLPDRERVILYLRFFEGMTQTEIADRVGVSQMHVSRLLRKSLREVHDLVTGEGE